MLEERNALPNRIIVLEAVDSNLESSIYDDKNVKNVYYS